MDNEVHRVSNNTRIAVCFGFAAILFIMGFILTPDINKLFEGLKLIVRHHSLANSDYFAIAGGAGFFGAAFINAGLLALCVTALFVVTDTKIEGVPLAALGITVGYSFYGKTIFNVWPMVFGVLLCAKLRGKELKAFTPMAWFAACLGPVTSALAFGTPALAMGTLTSILIGVVWGVLAGMMAGAMSSYTPKLHRGYTVFNGGFSAGIVMVLLYCLFKNIGWDHPAYAFDAYTKGQNGIFALCLSVTFVYFILCGLILEKNHKNTKTVVLGGFKGGNFVDQFGFGATCINIGICGFVSMGYMLLVGGELNGVTFGCIWTCCSFGACGVTPRAYISLLVGTFLTAFITGGLVAAQIGGDFVAAGLARANSVGYLAIAGFMAGICPISGDLGFGLGIIAGSAHTLIASNSGAWHGWMTTYNNGFVTGLIATFLAPILIIMSKKRNYEDVYKIG